MKLFVWLEFILKKKKEKRKIVWELYGSYSTSSDFLLSFNHYGCFQTILSDWLFQMAVLIFFF